MISKQPKMKKGIFGEKVTLTVSVTGPGNIKYQWSKKNNTDGTYTDFIGQGSQTSSLCFHSFAKEHIGDYKCVVSNEYDIIESDIICLKSKFYSNL